MRGTPVTGHPLVAILADDLTGSADAAAGFVAHGHSARVALVAGAAPLAPASVVAVSSNTRDLPAVRVHDALGPAFDLLALLDPTHLVKKVDSTLRGHLGLELELLRARFPIPLVVIAPAFPAQGRRIVEGRLVLEEAARDVPTVASCFGLARTSVTTLTLQSVRDRALVRVVAESSGVLLADAESDDDLDQLVAAVLTDSRPALWVGSGGLTAALARALPHRAVTPATRRPTPTPTPTPTGRCFVIAGSANRVTKRQLAVLEGTPDLDVHVVGAAELLGDPTRKAHRHTRLDAALSSEADLAIGLGGDVDATNGPALERALAELVAPRLSRGCGVVLTGGGTANAVLARAGVAAFELVEELAPGIPHGYAADAGLSIVTKAGGFGDDGALRDALEHLRALRRGTGAHEES